MNKAVAVAILALIASALSAQPLSRTQGGSDPVVYTQGNLTVQRVWCCGMYPKSLWVYISTTSPETDVFRVTLRFRKGSRLIHQAVRSVVRDKTMVNGQINPNPAKIEFNPGDSEFVSLFVEEHRLDLISSEEF